MNQPQSYGGIEAGGTKSICVVASSRAIEKRLGMTSANVPEDDAFWNIEADYIASALMNHILGGGVMQCQFLFAKIRHRVHELLQDHISSKDVLENIEEYTVPSGHGNQSGSLGAIELAMQLDGAINNPRS
jgi:fructokinase